MFENVSIEIQGCDFQDLRLSGYIMSHVRGANYLYPIIIVTPKLIKDIFRRPYKAPGDDEFQLKYLKLAPKKIFVQLYYTEVV